MASALEEVHIIRIKAGDTIEHYGRLVTVSERDIGDGFMGRTLFGDSYVLGLRLVRRVVHPTFYRGEAV